MRWLQSLPTLEVLVINLIATDICLKRKYSRRKTVAVLTLFTAMVFSIAYVFSDPAQYQGDGKMMLAGFVYLPVLYALYRVRLAELFTLMCSCWVYTFGIFSLAFLCSATWFSGQFFWSLFLETLFFLLSILLFFRQIVSKYAFVVENRGLFEEDWSKYILFNNGLQFLVLVVLHRALLRDGESRLKVILLVLLLGSVFLSNFILYRIILASIRMKRLEQEVFSDDLTGLGNRHSLLNRLKELLEGEQDFSILFMDLDRFKSVNDRYGHLVGDAYLKHFAKVGSRILGEQGRMYRYGGDEFAALYKGRLPDDVAAELQECSGWEQGAPCPFYQVSIGELYCNPPCRDTAEELIQRADQKMYAQKMKKKTL